MFADKFTGNFSYITFNSGENKYYLTGGDPVETAVLEEITS